MTGKPDIQEAAEAVRREGAPDMGVGGRAPHPSFPAGEPGTPTGPAIPPEPEPEAAETDHERELEHDLEELTAKADKADEYLELAKRTKADFENYRKRTARDTAVATQRGATNLANELLPAVDNLDRAIAHAPQGGEAEVTAFVDGIENVRAQLIAALQRAGIERYSPEGERFDPQLHEAIASQPVEGAAPGTVVEVYQRGYRLGEVVIRPARVVVSA
jgi:molecular chaperone GrpE